MFASPQFSHTISPLFEIGVFYIGLLRVNGEPIWLVVLRWSGESIWILPELKWLHVVRHPLLSEEYNVYVVTSVYARIPLGPILAYPLSVWCWAFER